METTKEELIKEQKELKEKLFNLIEYINSEEFYNLTYNNKQILKNQKLVMEIYLNILNMRVYENINNTTVPDFGLLGLFAATLNGGFNYNSPSDSIKSLIAESDKK